MRTSPHLPLSSLGVLVRGREEDEGGSVKAGREEKRCEAWVPWPREDQEPQSAEHTAAMPGDQPLG